MFSIELFSALCSKTRIEILKVLSDRPASVKEVMIELNRRGFQMKYRDSVYRALERLIAVDLVEKYYDSGERGIRYRLKKASITIDLKTGEIN